MYLEKPERLTFGMEEVIYITFSYFGKLPQKLIPKDPLSISSIVTSPCLPAALNDRLRDEIQQLKVATGQVNANIGKMGNFGMFSFGGNPQSYQRSHIQSLLAAQQLQQLQIHSQHQQQQTHLQQQQQHQLLQEAHPFPVDLKMRGFAMSSHAQNAGASDSHAVKSEP